MAAAWAARVLEDHFVFAEIRSAGTHAWDGAEAAAYAIDAMRELGFDLRAHRSQRLGSELMTWADHVIVMEPMHAEVAQGLLGVQESSNKIIGLWSYLEEPAAHVSDPHGQELQVYAASARSIGWGVEQLLKNQLEERRNEGS
jgi:protein-tyrosine-phosphatase